MRFRFSLLLLTLSAFLSLQTFAQTATTSVVVGTVSDNTGAALPGSEVELTNIATGQTLRQVTSESGQYNFPTVLPGEYNITVTAKGFRKASVSAVKIDVSKSYTFNVTMEVGELQQVVEITAGAVAELQTTDSTVGNVIQGRVMPLLPALTRQANELIRYQPASTPNGEVAGSRGDQSTFLLDGIDVTNNSVGGINTYMQLPIDGVEEFRAGVSNANSSFGRGAGGQVSVVSRRGNNQFHGATYWYHQNDALNAATWTNKRTVAQTVTDPVRRHKLQEPELKDNRFGFRFGGPIYPWKDKAFFFLNYEGRRFPRNTEFNRLVPTDTLRQGILRFRDAGGNVVSYPMATSALCGPTGDQRCDPRGLGLSPTITALWAKLPAGNDPGLGDGLNTIGYRSNVGNPLTNNYYNARVDYNISDKWRFDGAFRYFGQIDNGANLLSIEGGNPQSLEKFPLRQNMISTGVTGQLSSNLIGEFRFGWVRNRTATDRQRPNQSATKLAIPGTTTSAGAIALDIGALGGTQSLLSEPIDVGTQVARVQTSDNRIFQYNSDLTWTKGNHTMTFGSHIRYLPTGHTRDDKVVGSLGALVAQIDSDLGGGVTVSNANRPRTCGSGVTTNCLTAADTQQWNRLFASSLGLVDNINVLAVRDASFKPLPFGEVLVADTKLWAPEFYWQDTWRMRPSLTLTYGVNYGWQTPPKEKLGRQTVQVDGTTLQVQTAREYLRQREEAAAQGQIFNPKIAFLPVKDAKRDVFDIDWNNIGPRVAVAWNAGSSNKWLGKLFGDRKTVIRGGYSLVYDRQNTVQSVIIPTLGVAFGQTINVTGPLCNATGAGGTNCVAASDNKISNGFRLGVDGTIPLPVVPTQTVPVSPFWGIRPGSVGPPFPASALTLFPEVLSFQVDPKIQVGENHSIDLTWQRELPGQMLLEIGYIGRIADKLPQSMSFGQVPYNFLDTASKQTFAQAFDAVAAQVRSGTAAASVTAQPWFENQLRGTPICGTSGTPNACTAGLASAQGSNITIGNLNQIFLTIDQNRLRAGLAPFNNYLANTLFLRSSTGRSNYNGGFVTLQKRLSQGSLYTVNYTFSRALDQLGAVQNAASVMPNNFNLDAEYGPSPFDFTHLLNATGYYELPFGKGKRFDISNTFLNKLFGGWYTSGIFTAQSGAPLVVNQNAGGVWGGSLLLNFISGAIPTTDPLSFGNSANKGVSVSGNIGANGNAANRGSEINLFSNPEQVFNSFRRVNVATDGRAGRANPLRGMPRWNIDMSFGKKTNIGGENGVNITFAFDFFNLVNKVDFADPSLDLTNQRAFGVITSQFTPPSRTVGSRWIQFGMRVEF
jgi:hypothetical protein